jgi:hypothetical protein
MLFFLERVEHFPSYCEMSTVKAQDLPGTMPTSVPYVLLKLDELKIL